MLLRANDGCGGVNGKQNGLGSQEVHECPPDLAAWPIAPPHGLSWNRRSTGRNLNTRRITDGWLWVRRRRAWPEHGAHPSRLECGA